MLKKLFSKYLPQIIALLFLAGFIVYAWTEPTQAPPAGNVEAPLNVGPTAQTKTGDLTINGVIKTLKDLIVGSVTIKSDSSVSPGLNAEKLGGFFAKDISESGSVVGTITIRGYSGSGTCGGWGCSNCVCYADTICSPQGKTFCSGTIQQWPALNTTVYTPVCDTGYNLTLVSSIDEPVGGYCNYVPVTCPKKTYQCLKSLLVFPGCGNGVMEAGEVCDDGNQLNNVGYCSANCSKQNYFSQPQVSNNYIRNDSASANQLCKEQGFANYAKFNDYFLTGYTWCDTYGGTYCPLLRYWDGSFWQTIQNQWTRYAIWELWCSP